MKKMPKKRSHSTVRAKKASSTTSDAGLSAVLVPLLENLPRVKVQKKSHNVSFFIGKNVFAFTRPRGGMSMKLPEDRSQELVDAGQATFLTMGKRTMREWIVVNHEDPRAWEKDLNLFRESMAFVASLAKK